MDKKKIIWAFDLGKASIGEAVREDNRFLHKASLLIPADFADTKPAAARRRMFRTRMAHHERERWLEAVWETAGLHALYGRNRDQKTGDPKPGERGNERLEREFTKAGDDTCYTSCLLRIKLLRGERLEQWQIFKALHSAIQKRGYDKNIPWAEKEDLEKEEQKKDPNYLAAIGKWQKFKCEIAPSYPFPCYYDAWKMGLWNPSEPDKLCARTNHRAESTRNIRFDRADVDAEIKQLANNAASQVKELKEAFALSQQNGWLQADPVSGIRKHYHVQAKTFGDFLCHGPAGLPYASFSRENQRATGLRAGSVDDWMGALGQKIPRFDNRILEDCALIPRFHVCKAEIRQDPRSGKPFPESLLPAEVTFLMKLKNTLVAEGTEQRKLKIGEITKIFEVISNDAAAVKPDAKDWAKKIANCFALTKADWGRAKGIKELELRPLKTHAEVKPPKYSGRSGFSRPALRLLKELILSGKSPTEFYKEKLAEIGSNKDEKKGLVAHDLKFLRDMGNSWEDIYIPAQKLEALAARHTEDGKLDSEQAIAELLGKINDPIVRHRLGVFYTRLKTFRGSFGVPDNIVLEFVREDFMGPKRKAELEKFQREREKSRKEAREQAKQAGAEEKSAALKYELLKAQGCLCLFTGEPLPLSSLSDYEIEHIVPRNHPSGIIGPDAMINYVVTKLETNQAKRNRTPFEWFHQDMPEKWDAYSKRVESCSSNLRNKKVQLLLREDAPQLVERYTALAETAWISKLAQTIISLFFGWENGNDEEGRKRVVIVSGGLTARIRRKYRLNSLLNPCPSGEDPFFWEENCEKNREDDRHHALDAMVISFIPGWARDPKKEGFFRFPDGTERPFFEKEIADVVPRNICLQKPSLEDTIYGSRQDGDKKIIVKRAKLGLLAMKPVSQGKMKYDLDYASKQIGRIRDLWIRKSLQEFLSGNPDESAWKLFCENFSQKKADGSSGARIQKVFINIGQPDEYKDMSKDGTGAWQRGELHKGQIVYRDVAGHLNVKPIFVHSSLHEEIEKITKAGGQSKVYAVLRSDCTIRLAAEIPASGYKLVVRNEQKQKRRIAAAKPLPPGEYILNTIITKSQDVEFTAPNGQRLVAQLQRLVEAGLQRAD